MRKQSILISESVFRELSPLPGTFDYQYIKPHIVSTQDVHLQPTLGSKLYWRLQEGVYDNNLTTDETTLLDDYVSKLLVYYSLYAAASFLTVKIENTGIVQKAVNESTPISLNDADKLAEKLLSSAQFYKQRLIDYLNFNLDKYPLYKIAVDDDIESSTNNYSDSFNYDDDYNDKSYPTGSGGSGVIEHNNLTVESRALPDQHPKGAITDLVSDLSTLQQTDNSLQTQINNIIENSPVNVVRYFTRDTITLNGQLYNLSTESKGVYNTYAITTNITATTRETANIIARFVGSNPLANQLNFPAQTTSLLIKAAKNATNRDVVFVAEFYDYASNGTTTLKGSSSVLSLTQTMSQHDLLIATDAYTAAVGSRSLIVLKAYYTGTGATSQAIINIEGDYYSRWSYTLPVGSLSYLDEKVISTQNLPEIGSVQGETQKQVNAELAKRVRRVISFNNSTSIMCRDYYEYSSSLTSITARGTSLVEMSTDNITFTQPVLPVTVSGDIWWRITYSPSIDTATLLIKGITL